MRHYSEAARESGVAWARVSQVVNLPVLPVEVQEEVFTGSVTVSERLLRS